MSKKRESGEIRKVGDLFEKYKHTLIPPERTVIKTFCEVVEEILGVAITPAIVRYTPTTGTLSILRGGPLKSEIQLHKAELIAHLKGRLGEKRAPKDIL